MLHLFRATKELSKSLKKMLRPILWDATKHAAANKAYRADIDGLRAVAVLAVVFYHAFPKIIPGGFVGVDVFFVISGFLITGIIYRNLKNNTFSLVDFWSRRIRRIFPALLTVIITVLVAGWLYLVPSEFAQLKSHAYWSLFFAANFKFNSEIGYFDKAAELKPLLHLWSLAIEEQFYLIWPLILCFCFRRRQNILAVTFGLTLLSFCFRRILPQSLGAKFYLPWNRFWELQIGALVSILAEDYRARAKTLTHWLEMKVQGLLPRGSTTASLSKFTKTAASLAGASLIAYACLNLNKYAYWPSKFTLMPVLGTVLIIVAGRDAWVNRTILSLRPMVFIGIISFPLYLWHWPLLSFLRIVHNKPSTATTLAVLTVAMFLAMATFFYVEKVLRFESKSSVEDALPWKAFGLLAASLAIMVMMSGSSDFSKKDVLYIDKHLSTKAGFTPKAGRYCKDNFQNEDCELAHEEMAPTIALLGDSHANSLFRGLVEKLSDENILLLSKSGTPPLYRISRLRGGGEDKDSTLTDVIDKALKIESLKTIILAGFWGSYIEENGIVIGESLYVNGLRDELNPNQLDKSKSFRSGMIRTIEEVNKTGKNLVIFYDNPSLPFTLSTCIPRPGLASRFVNDCTFNLDDAQETDSRSRALIKDITDGYPDVVTVDLFAKICANDVCRAITEDGRWLYTDEHHLSVFGSSYVLKDINPKKLTW